MVAVELAKIAILMGAVILTVFVVAPVAQEHGQGPTELEVYDAWRLELIDYHENSENDTSKTISAMFSKYECCGIKNWSYDFQLTVDSTLARGFIYAPERPQQYYTRWYIIPITCCRGFNYTAELTSKIFEDHNDCLSRPNETTAYTRPCLPFIMADKLFSVLE